MTSTISAPAVATPAETTEILRFLRRFADLMSTGSNSDNLLRAARLLESHIELLKQSEGQLQAERIRADAASEIRNVLEERIEAFEKEVVTLKAELTEQQLRATVVMAEMEARQSRLLQRAEGAESRLAAAENQPPAIPPGSIAVPLSALRLAKAQFESLARAFEKSGNVVSQAMCEASVTSLDRVLLDSGADEPEHRSQDAAA